MGRFLFDPYKDLLLGLYVLHTTLHVDPQSTVHLSGPQQWGPDALAANWCISADIHNNSYDLTWQMEHFSNPMDLFFTST